MQKFVSHPRYYNEYSSLCNFVHYVHVMMLYFIYDTCYDYSKLN